MPRTNRFQAVPSIAKSSFGNLSGPGASYSSYEAGTYWNFGDDVMGWDGLTESVTSTFTPIVP